MAKHSRSISYKNATICFADMSITEYSKDETKTFSLVKLLKDWDGIDGVSLTVKLDEDAPADGE